MEKNPFNDIKAIQRKANATGPAARESLPESPVPDAKLAAFARNRRWLPGVIAVALAFVLGFVPMWFQAGRYAGERDAARREWKLVQLESMVAAAAVDARRGDYESARQAGSQFFTALRLELDAGPDSTLSLTQKNALKPLLAHRDDFITLLARSDPASAEWLTDVYLFCRRWLRGG